MISTDSEEKMVKSVQRLDANTVREREKQTYLPLAFCYLPVSTAAGQQTHLPLSHSTGAHLRMLRTKLNVINHRKGCQQSGTYSAEWRRRTDFLCYRAFLYQPQQPTVAGKWLLLQPVHWCHYLLEVMLTRALPLHPNARLANGNKK